MAYYQYSPAIARSQPDGHPNPQQDRLLGYCWGR